MTDENYTKHVSEQEAREQCDIADEIVDLLKSSGIGPFKGSHACLRVFMMQAAHNAKGHDDKEAFRASVLRVAAGFYDAYAKAERNDAGDLDPADLDELKVLQ